MRQQLICKACGGHSFTKGKLSNDNISVTPIENLCSVGSPLILTFCKDCGEVASIKVKYAENF
ncbi:hypothetical protein D0469_02350 [Peribacillus saganii]|uniref:Transcription initiation factor TFIIIB n=1 Tax=Peribacillus saganii TaxID=2303992 RepID=A0A372LT56_9BACI|nr:hypothetical protein D0469_02350 [Peribacillus saganii]